MTSVAGVAVQPLRSDVAEYWLGGAVLLDALSGFVRGSAQWAARRQRGRSRSPSTLRR